MHKVEQMHAQLNEIRAFFADQKLLSFNSSSILILYEDTRLIVRLIDFAHCYPLSGEENASIGFISCAPPTSEQAPSLSRHGKLHGSLGGSATRSQAQLRFSFFVIEEISNSENSNSLAGSSSHGRKLSASEGLLLLFCSLFLFHRHEFFLLLFQSAAAGGRKPSVSASLSKLQGGVDKVIGDPTPRVDDNYLRGLDSLIAIAHQIKL